MADSDYRGSEASAVAILFLVTSWIAVMMRVYVRGIMTKSFGMDDYLAVVTLFLFTFYCAFVLDGVHYGTGRHIWDIDNANFVIGMKCWWVAEIGYVACTTVLKVSIGYFLLRVCVKRYQKVIIWVVVGVVTAYSIYYFFMVIFQCRPTEYFWNRFDGKHHGTCVSNSLLAGSTYAHSALSVIADWTLGLLPITLVWDLDMNPRTKVSVAVILALGALGSTATIVRVPYIHQLTETLDFLYDNVDVSIWSTIEPGMGLTASSMATLRPLFKTFLARSRLIGSSNKQPSSRAWPQSNQPGRHGYIRSSSKAGPNDAEQLRLGNLRYDLHHHGVGVGTSTIIESLNDPRNSNEERKGQREQRQQREQQDTVLDDKDLELGDNQRRFKRFGSGNSKILPRAATPGSWDLHDANYVMTDSSSENSTVPGGLGIRKTTHLKTQRE